MKKALRPVLAFALIVSSIHTVEAAQTLDDLTVADQPKWNCARSIAIKLFPMDEEGGEFSGAKEFEFYQKRFANKLAPGLKKIPGVETVEIDDGKSAIAADLVIDGSFVDLTAGSRALRFWVGFGAGRSICRVDMKGVDASTGAEVFRLDHYRASALDIINDDEVIENIDEVVEDVVTGLMAARGNCGSAPSSR